MTKRRKASGKSAPSRRLAAARRSTETPPRSGIPITHPALVALAVAIAAALVVGVTFRLDDPDLWQHLAVGRAIWRLREIPRLEIWSWPTYGRPQVLPSWGFRALLWPFYAASRIEGLFVWRWLTTLLVFGVTWATARRMGARGASPLVVIAIAALTYRHRSQVRPETLVAVLLALELWVLESMRHRAHGPAGSKGLQGFQHGWPWLVAIAWAWANVHLSYHFGLAVLAAYALEATFRSWRYRSLLAKGEAAAMPGLSVEPRALWLALAAAIAVSFLNPFGWRALAEPFRFFLFERQEPIFRHIRELQPVDWASNRTTGLPFLLGAWALLLAWRTWRRGLDLAGTLVGALFVVVGLTVQRFLGLTVVALAPFVARDLSDWIATLRLPAWTARPWLRTGAAAAIAVTASLPEWSAPDFPLGIGVRWSEFPVAASDFMRDHDVSGRGFNPFHYGGYLLWRFWPDRGRLPFMDVHQSGGPAERHFAAESAFDRGAFHDMLAHYDFDWALLDRLTPAQARLLDFFDQDSSWAPVFLDDAAALFVRREPRFAALRARYGYELWPAGSAGIDDLAIPLGNHAEVRVAARAELERQVESSPWNATAHNFLANLDLVERRDLDAARELGAVLAVNPRFSEVHSRLGEIALRAGRRDEAAREFERELAIDPRSATARAALSQLGR